MTEIQREIIGPPQAWKASELAGGKAALTRRLTLEEVAACDAALAAIKAKGLGLDDLEREHFDLPALVDLAAELREEVMSGKGIVVLAGLPVDRLSTEEMGYLYWGLGTHLGVGVSQSAMGDRLGHVIDVSGKDPRQRAYRNSCELTLHTDLSDIISLCSLRCAEQGGESLFASALAVHNEMLEKHPEELAILYRGFPYHRFGEQGPDQEPITPYRVPHFANVEGQVSLRYVRQYIELAADEAGPPLSDQERAALDTFDAIARRPDMAVEFMLEPGEAVFVNNLTVMHARRGFDDGAQTEAKRHLLRLWLDVPNGRPTVPEMFMYQDEGGIAGQDRETSYYEGSTQPQYIGDRPV